MTSVFGRPRTAARGPRLLGALALVAVVTGCASERPLPSPVDQWPVITVRVDGQELEVVVAEDRVRGLQGVADLGELDGMLFDYGREVDPDDHGFWMQGVPMPLDIAWFGDDGRAVGSATMPVCDSACPVFRADAAFRWALETPAGTVRRPDQLSVGR